MKYKCTVCKYSTSVKYNFERHEASQRHIDKIKLANSEVTESKLDITIDNMEKPKSNEIIELKDEIINLLKKQQQDTEHEKKYMKQQFEKDKDFMKKMLEGAGSVAHKQMSAINYIIQKFPHAPELKQIEDFSTLANENDLVKTLIYHYDIKNLVAYLGDYIIEFYRNEDDPDNQSIWNSDTHRLTYIIRLSTGDKLDWHVDKDAVRLIDIVIAPILTNLRKEIYNRVKSTPPNEANYVEFQLSASKIIKSIDNETLAKDLARHIAPKFQVIRGG